MDTCEENLGSLGDNIVWLGKDKVYLEDDMHNQRI